MRKKTIAAIVAGVLVGTALVIGVPTAAQAATASVTQYSTDNAVKVVGHIQWNSAYNYSASWTIYDLKADGKTPYTTVWADSMGANALKKEIFPTPFSPGYRTTYYSGSKISGLQVAVCNGDTMHFCKYKLYDNPYS